MHVIAETIMILAGMMTGIVMTAVAATEMMMTGTGTDVVIVTVAETGTEMIMVHHQDIPIFPDQRLAAAKNQNSSNNGSYVLSKSTGLRTVWQPVLSVMEQTGFLYKFMEKLFSYIKICDTLNKDRQGG